MQFYLSEIPIFFREHQNRMYRVISYYMSRIFLDVNHMNI